VMGHCNSSDRRRPRGSGGIPTAQQHTRGRGNGGKETPDVRGRLGRGGREENRRGLVCFTDWASWTDLAYKEKMIFIFPKAFSKQHRSVINLGKNT
jgi:hypothetical protein